MIYIAAVMATREANPSTKRHHSVRRRRRLPHLLRRRLTPRHTEEALISRQSEDATVSPIDPWESPISLGRKLLLLFGAIALGGLLGAWWGHLYNLAGIR